MVLTFYTEKEDKRKGISPFYRRYHERGVCNKCPPEVTKRVFVYFKNINEGIIFINGGNPKATNFILEQKIPQIIPIKISNELRYSNSKVAELFNRLNKEEIIDSINDMQVAVRIKRQNEFIYKTLVFKEVGSFEEYQKLVEKHSNVKVNKFSVNLNILEGNKKVKLTFRSLINLNPIGTSLKTRAYDSYIKLFTWLGNILIELSTK